MAVYLFVTGRVLCDESSTHLPVNRGAARQMYGSGSLRQTGSGPILVGTTGMPHRAKDNQNTNNDMRNEEKSSESQNLPELHDGTIDTCPWQVL